MYVLSLEEIFKVKDVRDKKFLYGAKNKLIKDFCFGA